MDTLKERRFTLLDIVRMEDNQFKGFCVCYSTGAWRLFGIGYKDYVEWFTDIMTGDVVVRYD